MSKGLSAAWSAAVVLALVCGMTGAKGQEPSGEGAAAAEVQPSTVLGAQRHALAAQHIDQTYQIDVFPAVSPLRPPAPGEKLPVVFVLDGNLYFPMVASMAALLTLEEIPSMLIVGVGYDFAPSTPAPLVMLEVQTRRNRDLTPSVDEAFVTRMTEMYQGFGAPYPPYGQPGGADAFLAFINDELKPFIAERYPNADVEDATIMGLSFGGLFAMHALFTAPDSFDRYVAGSPSLFWDEGVTFAAEAAASDVAARLFISTGELEDEAEMRAPVARMDALLRDGRRPSLSYTFNDFAGETHASVIPATFSRGLREVFAAN
jgi:predicted alpha/beta superfamily hydrolase